MPHRRTILTSAKAKNHDPGASAPPTLPSVSGHDDRPRRLSRPGRTGIRLPFVSHRGDVEIRAGANRRQVDTPDPTARTRSRRVPRLTKSRPCTGACLGRLGRLGLLEREIDHRAAEDAFIGVVAGAAGVGFVAHHGDATAGTVSYGRVIFAHQAQILRLLSRPAPFGQGPYGSPRMSREGPTTTFAVLLFLKTPIGRQPEFRRHTTGRIFAMAHRARRRPSWKIYKKLATPPRNPPRPGTEISAPATRRATRRNKAESPKL
jgi:hypothetical protein